MPQSKNTTKTSGKSSTAKKPSSAKKNAKTESGTRTKSAPERQPLSENPVWNAAAPYVLAGLAILTAVCVILGQGRIGGGIRNLLTGLFGGAAYALPVFLLFRALRRNRDREEERNTERTIGTAAAFLLLTMLLHVLGGGAPELDLKTHLLDGMELIGGGIFGGVLGELLLRGFGRVCALILLPAGIVLLTLYSAGVTPRGLVISIVYHIKYSGEKREERRAAAEEKRKNAPPTRSQVREAEHLEYLRQKRQLEREAREAEAAARLAAAQNPPPTETVPAAHTGNPDVFRPDQLNPIGDGETETPAASTAEKKIYRVRRRPISVDIPVNDAAEEPVSAGPEAFEEPAEEPKKKTREKKETTETVPEDGPERILPERSAAERQSEGDPIPETPIQTKPEASGAADQKLFEEVMRRTRERIEKCRRAETLRSPGGTSPSAEARPNPDDGSAAGEKEELLPAAAFREPTEAEASFAGFDAEVSDLAELPAEENGSDSVFGESRENPEDSDSDYLNDPEGFVELTDTEDAEPPVQSAASSHAGAETDSVKLAVDGDGKLDVSGIFASPEDAELLDKLAEAYRNPLEVHRESVSASLPASEPQQKPVLAAKPEYRFPPIEILAEDPGVVDDGIKEELQENAVKLVDTLRSFNVKTKIVNISRGPTITRYELQPEPGTKVRSITNLVDDISLNMATGGVRIEAPIPGKAAVGVEVPNKKQSVVHLRTLIEDSRFVDAKSKLTVCLGEDVAGEAVYFDIAKMPHLLIAGATGAGKSVCINSVITSILYKASPEDVKLILIDPKKVELNIYNGIPHLLVPVVSEPKKAAGSLSWAVGEMERRYGLIEEAGVRDIKAFNEVTKNDPDYEYMPRIVIIIDELADLMMTAPDDVEESICRIAQKARAAGMHLIIGTQRPSVDVITGLIKANVPSRIAFRTSSQIDSRTIIDIGSAANLIGMGDMLFNPVGALKPNRVQGAYVSESDVEEVVSYIKNMNAAYMNGDSEKIVNEIEREAQKCGAGKKGSGASSGAEDAEDAEDGEDPLLKQAVEIAVESGKIATSLLQRRLSVGYGRAAKLIDRMEQLGYVSAPEGTKPRRVLISRQDFMEMRLKDEAPFDV